MLACLTSWTSSGFFLEIICVGEEQKNSRQCEGLLSKRCQRWFSVETQFWLKQWVPYTTNDPSLECKNETSPTFITGRMAGRQAENIGGSPLLIKLGVWPNICKTTARTGILRSDRIMGCVCIIIIASPCPHMWVSVYCEKVCLVSPLTFASILIFSMWQHVTLWETSRVLNLLVCRSWINPAFDTGS